MRLNYISKNYILQSVFLSLIVLFSPLVLQNIVAQSFSSRQQQSDFDMFNSLRTTNRDSAYIFAERIASEKRQVAS